MTQPGVTFTTPGAPGAPFPGTMEEFLATLQDPAERRAYEAARMKAWQTLAAARLLARAKAPYFRPMILTMVPREVPGLGTVAVTKSAILLYDPLVVSTWTVPVVAGSLVHEVFHLWNRHFERCGTRDPQKYNRAGDRAINPGVLQVGLELPEGVLFPRDLGLADGLTADEYYLAEENGGGGSGGRFGAGACGSCASGHSEDHEPDDADPQARTQGQLKRAAQQVSEAMIEHASKDAGSLPAGWKRIAEESVKPPKVDWRRELGYQIRTAMAYAGGASVHRYDQPGRRQAGLGYGDGVPILPRARKPLINVALVLDTSASVGAREMGSFLREANGVIKSLGAAVTFAVADTEVQGMKTVRRIEDMGEMLAGGGGTDFVPAFEALAAQRPVPDVIIYGTDGFGRAPEDAPIGSHVIWALIGPYVQKPAAWGKAIRVKDDDADDAATDDEEEDYS